MLFFSLMHKNTEQTVLYFHINASIFGKTFAALFNFYFIFRALFIYLWLDQKRGEGVGGVEGKV